MSRIILLLVSLIPVLTLLPACGKDPQVAAVNKTDDDFDVALNSCNGEAAAGFLSSDSIKWLDQMVKNARTLSKAKAQALPASEMHETLQARLLCTRDELKKMDGRAYYAKVMSTGKYGSTSHMKRLKVKISEDRTRATITYLDPDTEETTLGHWVWENAWKSDLLADHATTDRESREWIAGEGMTMPEFVTEMLAETWEREVPESIWNPKN